MTDALLPISSARSASKRLGLRSMIVLQELPDGRWGYTSYGKTKADCGRARKIADDLLSEVQHMAEWEDR
ncbi:MAG TPA: hypothetical protein PKA33_01500 [Amaricoccus sp.]|uniref:hypothetical protein n=1 Tax=Amaricoccus sp. TaxID=1872485 RepID=UPI002BC6E9A4|nr:hypothetical protein [Amaricoccus sp.]HMQ38988.1 hypothetical protein [Micropruina sp.]HMR51230.1 hypothetical protein [Amaricoccus sp.]HMT98021.1 hypothetical protein [Amaricoccus sp.]